MSQRLPALPGRTEAAFPPRAFPRLDLDRLQGHVCKAAVRQRGLAQSPARVRSLGVQEPQLEEGIGLTRRRQLGEELGRRERFGRQPGGRGDFALGHAHRVVHAPGGVDLHGHRVRVARVDPVEVQDLLEVEEQPLDAPPAGVEGERLGGRQARGIEDVGEHGPHRAPPLPADVAEQLHRGAPTAPGLHHPIGEAAPLGDPACQAADLAEAEPPIAPDQAPAALRREGREPHPVAVEPIGEHEGVPRERAHRRPGAGQLPRGGVGAEGQGATEPAAQVVDGEQTPRQHHRPLGPQELQAVRDGREA